MVYCQECGSEITEVETFCPFCGISLQTQNIANDESSESLETQENSELTTGDNDFVDSEIVLNSDDSGDIGEQGAVEEINMAETMLIERSILVETDNEILESDEATPTDSGYLDIKTLKADEEEFELEKATETEENLDESIDEPKSSGLELGGTGELNGTSDSKDSTDLKEIEDDIAIDISDAQDDIEELLTDDDEASESVESPNEIKESAGYTESQAVFNDSTTETVEESSADEEAINVVTDIVEEVASTSEPNLSETDESETVENAELEVKDDDATIHDTPIEIKTAKDSEIDEAVAVIDSKALVWKKDDEIMTTDSINNESEDVDIKIEISNIEPTETEIADVEELDTSEPETDSEPKLIKDESINDVDKTNKNPDGLSDENDEIVAEKMEEPAIAANEVLEATDSKPEESAPEPEIEAAVADDSIEEHIADKSEALSTDEPEVISQTTPNIGVSDTDGRKSQKLKPLDEGVVLNNRYEIVRKIGGGGMGAVYLANDKNLGGVLRAVKEMVQSYIEEEQQDKAIKDFKRESTLLTQLDHPSIPTIYDYFYDEKEARFYLVMKYISGGDLAARLRATPEGRLDEVSVTDWALQIADVLDYLHNRKTPIVYRDLKPANIMVDGNTERVMLIDFGIARWINKEEKGVTAVGTMGYAPPELFSGNVEPSSDIYSLGSTMFHLMTGADPQSNPLLIFDFQKHPRPRQINPQLSDQMERILMRAVEYSADKRFSSAAEMRNSLSEHLENLKNGNVSFGIKATPTAVALSDQPVFCGFCGQKIVATDMFCAFCGAKQPLSQPGVHSQEYHILKTTAKLIIEGTTELTYQPFELVKNENLVGRRDPMSNIFPEIDLSKFDPQTKISRQHARIWRDGDNYLLEDLGSSNGTIFKPALSEEVKLMPKQKQVLQNGDKIQIGDTTLQFMVE